jgi:NADPH:quinone reductase-like Zn-dependent oxidoreductase
MRAIVYREYGGPEVLQLAEVSEPRPAKGQVLVRVEASSINAADYRLMRANPFLVRLMNGLWRPVKRRVLGQDVAGVVVAIGEGVTRFALGDRVFGETPMNADGAFADSCVAEEGALARLPDEVGFDEGAALPLAGTTAIQGLRAASVKAGDRVLIAGAGGGVGLFAVQIARALGATVTASCGPKSLELVRSLGAHEVIDYQRTSLESVTQTFDAVVAINGYQRLSTFRRLLSPGGRYVMVGGSNAQLFQALLFAGPYFALFKRRGATLSIDPTRQSADLEQLAKWKKEGVIRVVIDRAFSLEATAEAMALAERGHVRGKIVLTTARA